MRGVPLDRLPSDVSPWSGWEPLPDPRAGDVNTADEPPSSSGGRTVPKTGYRLLHCSDPGCGSNWPDHIGRDRCADCGAAPREWVPDAAFMRASEQPTLDGGAA